MMTAVKKLFGGRSEIARFFNSVGFIWIVAGVTFLFWALKQQFAGIAVLLVLATAVALFCEDATPAIACVTFVFFIFSEANISFAGKELWCILVILPVGAFIYNIIKFKAKNFYMGGFSLSIAVCLVPWLLQGVGRSGRDVGRALICVALALVYCIFYFAFRIMIRREKNHTEYMANVLLAVGVLILVQILFYHYSQCDFSDFSMTDFLLRKHGFELGWGTTNPVATVFSLTLPIPFYFSTKKRKLSFLFLILGYAEFFVIILTRSRGVGLICTLAMPFLMIYSVVAAKNKLPNLIINCVAAAVVIGVAIFKIELIQDLYYRLVENKLDSNGRAPVWADGIELFTKYPVFGGGFDYVSQVYFDVIGPTGGPTFFHSTFIQIFASMGLLGGACYAYLYYWRYRVALTDITPVKLALLAGMIIFEGFCFIDTIFFHPVGYYLLMMISLFTEKDLRREQITPLAVGAFIKRREAKKTA